ncbi:MAG: hypothetical protein AAB778_03805 [Patescibacteria group bacterium]
MAKDHFDESRKAAEALAQKLGVTLKDLQELYRRNWQQLGPSFGRVVKKGSEAKPIVVEYDENGKVINTREL